MITEEVHIRFGLGMVEMHSVGPVPAPPGPGGGGGIFLPGSFLFQKGSPPLVPTQAHINQIAAAIAAMSTTWGAAGFCRVRLIQEAFSPTPQTDLTALTEADFGGYAVKAATIIANAWYDTGTAQWHIMVPPPAGGWNWECNAATNVPQTIFGYTLEDIASSTKFASGLLLPPVEITGVGDAVNLGVVEVVIPSVPVS